MKNKTKKIKIFIAFIVVYIIVVIFFHFVETYSGESNIKTLFDSFWYSIVTLTTVGYGDHFPVTIPGRIISLIFIFASLGILGVFIGKISEIINERKERKKMGFNGTNFSNHVIIIGWDKFSKNVAIQLINAHKKVAVVTDKKEDIDFIYEDFEKESIFALYSDLKNIPSFEKVNIEKSNVVFVNLGDDTENLVALLNLKKAHPKTEFLVSLNNSDLRDTFYTAGVTYVLSKNEIAAQLTASYIFEPDVASFESDILSTAENEDDFDIQQYRITKNNPYLNKSYGEVFNDLKSKFNVLTVGISKCIDGKRNLIKLPKDSEKVELDNFLLFILNGAQEKKIEKIFNVSEGLF